MEQSQNVVKGFLSLYNCSRVCVDRFHKTIHQTVSFDKSLVFLVRNINEVMGDAVFETSTNALFLKREGDGSMCYFLFLPSKPDVFTTFAPHKSYDQLYTFILKSGICDYKRKK